MTVQLQTFLKHYLSDEYVHLFDNLFDKSELKKGRHLFKPGQHCDYLAFIQQGCFRVYYYDQHDKEIITWFSFEEMVITDMLAFYTTGVARFYVEALEDSIIYKVGKKDLETLYKQHPSCLDFGRKLAEESLTMLMKRTMALHTKSAEERYRELLSQPNFMQKIPLKYLASFLGITDTSLSRIRKNII